MPIINATPRGLGHNDNDLNLRKPLSINNLGPPCRNDTEFCHQRIPSGTHHTRYGGLGCLNPQYVVGPLFAIGRVETMPYFKVNPSSRRTGQAGFPLEARRLLKVPLIDQGQGYLKEQRLHLKLDRTSRKSIGLEARTPCGLSRRVPLPRGYGQKPHQSD